MKKVLIVCIYPKNKVPGQRFRFEQYLDFLSQSGFEITFSNLLSEEDYSYYYRKGSYFKKFRLVLKSWWKRFRQLNTVGNYDLIFIFREAFFLGNSYFEKQFAKKSKVIFDYDDAIWITSEISKNNKLFHFLKNPNKTAKIIKTSKLIFAGNDYLANYAKQFNQNVRIVPTTIDTDKYLPSRNFKKEKICIGWSGSFSTIVHFETCLTALKKIKEKYRSKVYFKVIGSSDYYNKELEIQGLAWESETEIEDLKEIDIGIMPLPNDEWAKGKCGLKGLQYMALGIPTIMSPVGVNNKIINDGVNGFLAGDVDEWVKKMSLLIESEELRRSMGEKGRETVVLHFSVEANKYLYLKYFNDALNN
jgi:glycosyltransferase involved in cell wall biosynthesis